MASTRPLSEKRTPLTEAQVGEVWRRWRSGQAIKVLAREMRRHPSTVRELLKRCGGVRPVARHRHQLWLSLAEREEISRGLAAGDSLRGIARGLGRAPSTISREVAGHGGRFAYRALPADRGAWARGATETDQAVAEPRTESTPNSALQVVHRGDRSANTACSICLATSHLQCREI